MNTFKAYMLRKAYKRVHQLGDKLVKAEALIDWKAFRPIISPLYSNKTSGGGRPNVNEVMIVKLLVLQQWYGLSDPELERQVADRLSFQRFLGFPRACRTPPCGSSGSASPRQGGTGWSGRSFNGSWT